MDDSTGDNGGTGQSHDASYVPGVAQPVEQPGKPLYTIPDAFNPGIGGPSLSADHSAASPIRKATDDTAAMPDEI